MGIPAHLLKKEAEVTARRAEEGKEHSPETGNGSEDQTANVNDDGEAVVSEIPVLGKGIPLLEVIDFPANIEGEDVEGKKGMNAPAKPETEALIAEKDAKIRELEERYQKSEQKVREGSGMLKSQGSKILNLEKIVTALADAENNRNNEKTLAALNERKRELAERFGEGEEGEAVLTGINDIVGHDVLSKIEKIVAPLKEKIASFEQEKEQVKEENYSERIQKIPNVVETNNSYDFKKYLLGKTDNLTGYTYAQIIDMAENARNAGPIEAVFNEYYKEKGITHGNEKQEKLESLASPPPGKTAEPAKQQQEKITKKQVMDFYAKYQSDLRRGLLTTEQKQVYEKKAAWIDDMAKKGHVI